MDNPRGVATSPTSGHIFVVDLNNARINEFTAWGEFVSAWGFGVDTGAIALEVCTTASGCQEGIKGSAPGQLGSAWGVAVDAGSVYVFDGNSRVTKYSEDGEFLLMFGGNVNQTTGAEVCTAADIAGGDVCGAGTPGTGPGFFENGNVGNFIAIGPAGTIFVGDQGRIQEFNPDGTFKGEIPFAGDLAALAGETVFGLAIDQSNGDIYFTTVEDPAVYRIAASGALKEEVKDTVEVEGQPKTFPVNARNLAVDSAGNLYVLDRPAIVGIFGPYELLKFDPSGNCLICGQNFAEEPSVGSELILTGIATSSACGILGDDIYVAGNKPFVPRVSYLQSYGPPPQDVENCPPPEIPPAVTDQFAVSVGDEEAEVRAQINPNFWNDTTYYVQYGPQECLDSGWTTGCLTEPVPPGDLLTEQVLNRPVPTDEVPLDGLTPDTTYHYRFVAQSSGGGPVFGAQASFHTFPEVLPSQSCPDNQAFRTALSAFLPECRAYEMVSPVDKNGGDILTQNSIRDFPVELSISALDGEQVTYSSEAAFGDSVSAPYSSQYIAKRDPLAGWQTEAISPPREKLFRPAGKAPLYELDNQYKLFTPDLGQSWLMQEADPPLDECGVEGYINWYRRDNATGSYEAVTTKPPPSGKDPLLYFSEVQGVGVDGEGRIHTIYRANDQLATDSGVAAAGISGYQLYEHISSPTGCGETRLVSVLPAAQGGGASSQSSTAGTAAPGMATYTFIESREGLVHNAVSADGSVVYWTAAGEGPGQIYVRLNGAETFAVSAGANARFWFASDDGSVAYFTEGAILKRFTLQNLSATEVAEETVGLVGASEDGERAYFVSRADLDGGGDAAAGKPNLYLLEGGAETFIATLSEGDVNLNNRLKPVTIFPVSRAASISEDGKFLAFTSNAPLTGQDNTDADSGLADTQAFFYEAESEELRCVSCNPTGARPKGRVEPGANNTERGYAAGIPPWKNQFHAPRAISADGSRVFFESLERLVPRDGNGMQDVYVWMRGADKAACEAVGAELFNAEAGGCISLISSGTGDDDATFTDSTPDGSDAFFRTSASLLPQDPGRVDLYDARVGGGFPPPTVCTDPDGCPPPPPVPPPPTATNPSSGTGTPNFDPEQCKPLQRTAQKFAAKARALRKKAAKAQGAKARALRKKAKKQTKKANRASAKAQRCLTGAGGK